MRKGRRAGAMAGAGGGAAAGGAGSGPRLADPCSGPVPQPNGPAEVTTAHTWPASRPEEPGGVKSRGHACREGVACSDRREGCCESARWSRITV